MLLQWVFGFFIVFRQGGLCAPHLVAFSCIADTYFGSFSISLSFSWLPGPCLEYTSYTWLDSPCWNLKRDSIASVICALCFLYTFLSVRLTNWVGKPFYSTKQLCSIKFVKFWDEDAIYNLYYNGIWPSKLNTFNWSKLNLDDFTPKNQYTRVNRWGIIFAMGWL